MHVSKDNKRIMSHVVEFFIVGLVMGVTEDIIAIRLATNAEITWEVFKIAFWVALPFAFISELLIDMKIIRRSVRRFLRNLRS